MRIAVWQSALLIAFAGLARTPAVTAAALLLLTLSATRIQGTWLSTLTNRALSWATRRRTFPGNHLPLPKHTTITDDGLISTPTGLTAVTRTNDWQAPTMDSQLVIHKGPRQQTPAAWLATTAYRTPDTPDDETLRRTLCRDRATDLHKTLHGIAHTGPSREHWRTWQSGGITQIGLHMTDPPIAALLARAGDTAITIAVNHTGDAVIRIAATTPVAAERAVTRIRTIRPDVRRMNGRHAQAVAATLPIGGTL